MTEKLLNAALSHQLTCIGILTQFRNEYYWRMNSQRVLDFNLSGTIYLLSPSFKTSGRFVLVLTIMG